jgi:hypothetical protein
METNTSKGGVRMAVTNYYSLNGRIIAEDTSGARTDYLRDALGSVVATTDQNQNVTTTARYAAYGTPFETTGNYSTLRFGWCGSWGYRKTQRSGTGLPQSETYVRARHYSTAASRWTNSDTFWPFEDSHAYARGKAVLAADPRGTRVSMTGSCGSEQTWGTTGNTAFTCYQHQLDKFRNRTQAQDQAIQHCLQLYPPVTGTPNPNWYDDYKKAFDSKDSKNGSTYCVFCEDAYGNYGLPDKCDWMVNEYCNTIWPGAWEAGYSCPPVKDPAHMDPNVSDQQRQDCKDALKQRGCDCATVICKTFVSGIGAAGSQECCNYVPFHEAAHCASGWSHTNGDQIHSPDWLTRVSQCICEVFNSPDSCRCGGLVPR